MSARAANLATGERELEFLDLCTLTSLDQAAVAQRRADLTAPIWHCLTCQDALQSFEHLF
ncbi:hypothetical protein [Kribbella kalugense]|uniref:hypothetical protein n=1 Tax=Kribbella kalugense TaxID=2512221 RepID=UPI0010661680|nr:hypothetical protein [Kribbella kalugense]